MDLHLIPGASPSPEERLAVDALLGPPQSGWDGGVWTAATDGHVARGGHAEARDRRHLLLPALWAVQGRVGWISPGAINYLGQRLTVPPADAYGVATFYSLLSVEPQAPRVVHLCDDIACRMRGAEALAGVLTKAIGPPGSATADGMLTWQRSPCLGVCERAPAILIQAAGAGAADATRAPIEAAGLRAIVASRGAAAGPSPENDAAPSCRGSRAAPQTLDEKAAASLCLLRRVGRVDPTSLDEYNAQGGYAALRRAFALGPEGVIAAILESKLMGRGGAAFPAGRKWEAVARAAARPHYLVCNADESEPGTFKDRVLMEEDPFALVEAMTIAGYAVGAERGYVYIRGEYPLAVARMTGAVAAARERGLLGESILGERLRFDIEVRRGAGAYICGEETALFNSIEGFRGEPRNKPPFPVQAGLFGKPTAINNVETLANVPGIVMEGGAAYATRGTPQSTGTKLFCLSGCVARPGVYEVTFGATLRQMIDLAGGTPGGRPIQAVLLGGAAGSFVTPAELDMPLTLEGTRAAGASLGSGVVMVFDDRVDLRDTVRRIAAFFRDESCGQCVPCRVGTQRQEEALARLLAGRPLGTVGDETARIADIAQAMRDASICGLGQTAAGVVQSAIDKLKIFGS